MPVISTCPSCHSRLKIPSKLINSGRTLPCPKCRAAIHLGSSISQASAEEFDVEPVHSAPQAVPFPASISCPHCGGVVGYNVSFAGQTVRCPYPKCGGQFVMPASVPAAAVVTPTVLRHPGSVRVGVLVEQRGRGFRGQAFADAGAIVLLIPKGVRAEIPWPAIVPGHCLLMRHYLPAHLQNSTFPQAQSQLRKSGAYAAATGAGGEAFFPTVAPGDYTVLILSNTRPDGVYMHSIRECRAAPAGHPLASQYPGLEPAETLLERNFGLGLGDSRNNEFDFGASDSQAEEMSLRRSLRNCPAHEGELTVLPGEETPYSVTF